ncbi:hypothetical protein IWQ61_009261 [Dispira simplex]|nr:hypothetical protein IWQ61_009261 [Dispira simplex]
MHLDDYIQLIERDCGGYTSQTTTLATQLYHYKARYNETGGTTTSSAISTSTSQGALITGAPGTGKTYLAQRLVHHLDISYHFLDGTQVFHTDEGQSERYLTTVFQALVKQLPAVLVIDNVEVLCPASPPLPSALVRRVYTRFLALLDAPLRHNRSHAYSGIPFILATTGDPQAVASSLLRTGRLDTTVTLGLSRAVERLAVLRIVSSDLPLGEPAERETTLITVANLTPGFTPADLQNLCLQIAQILAYSTSTDPTPRAHLAHFRQVLETVRPSGLADLSLRIPRVYFDQIYGLDSVIAELKSTIIRPFQEPELYDTLGIQPPTGVLLHGPPGVGKTMLCCALATESGLNTILVDGTQVRSKYVGESEKALARLFLKARQSAPCIMFIDQLDMVAPPRGTRLTSENSNERIVASFLTEMDGFHSKTSLDNSQGRVFVVATTSRPRDVDPALLRPGRFDHHIHIDLPNMDQRRALLRGMVQQTPLTLSDSFLAQLIDTTQGLSGADLKSIIQEAALCSLRTDITHTYVEEAHVVLAVRSIFGVGRASTLSRHFS